MEEWRPGIQQEMLRGPATSTYGWITLWSVGVLMVSAGGLTIGMIATGKGYLDSWFTAVAMVLFLLSTASTIVAMACASRKRAAEFRAGYTTAVAPEYPEVDPVSRQVVRLANEELPVGERRRRVALVRGSTSRRGA